MLLLGFLGWIPLSVGNQHILHLVIPPNDLYKPIVEESFPFYIKDTTKTFDMLPRYLDFYDVGFLLEKEKLPSDFKFQGQIKFEIFRENEMLLQKIVVDPDSWSTNKVSLMHFEIPVNKKYKDNLRMKVTVLTPDVQLEKFADSLKLFISVSNVP